VLRPRPGSAPCARSSRSRSQSGDRAVRLHAARAPGGATPTLDRVALEVVQRDAESRRGPRRTAQRRDAPPPIADVAVLEARGRLGVASVVRSSSSGGSAGASRNTRSQGVARPASSAGDAGQEQGEERPRPSVDRPHRRTTSVS
jgi:hypothetical protein